MEEMHHVEDTESGDLVLSLFAHMGCDIGEGLHEIISLSRWRIILEDTS